MSEQCKDLVRSCIKVNVEDRIKLEELPAHPWLQAAPAPGVVAGVGVPIPSARPAPAPGHTLNSVGSTASQSPPPAPAPAPSHAKLYRRTGAGPGSSADRRGKLTKNTENILAAGDFPPLPPAPASYKLSVKDLKNEANEARKAEVGRGGWGVFCPAPSPAPGTSCRVKVEQMEGADTMQLLSHATAYATL